jgi:Rps23 Pro-64 3,4-dihydroxylase Tpa1-like proline 4-hydroxylase
MLTLASTTHFPEYAIAEFDDFSELNRRLHDGFLQHQHATTSSKDHFFGGRFENIYIDETAIPSLSILRQAILACASDILHIPVEQLRYGAWFNAMAPGDCTLPHNHDDYDEKLSAVYYIHAEPRSGDLTLQFDTENKVTITPQAGRCVFFSPACEHHVSENLSDDLRLSIGINIGVPQD